MQACVSELISPAHAHANFAVCEDQNVVLQIEAFSVSPIVLGFKRTFGRHFLTTQVLFQSF